MEDKVIKRSGQIRIVFLILLILSVLCAFFPFRIETVQEGMQSVLFGNLHNVNPSRRSMNAFDLPIIFTEHGILLIAALLLVMWDNRALRIIGLIFTVIAGLFMFILYAILNFQLNLFGNRKTIEIGSGYFFLLLVYIVFLIHSVVSLRSAQISTKSSLAAPDLLDDPFSN